VYERGRCPLHFFGERMYFLILRFNFISRRPPLLFRTTPLCVYGVQKGMVMGTLGLSDSQQFGQIVHTGAALNEQLAGETSMMSSSRVVGITH